MSLHFVKMFPIWIYFHSLLSSYYIHIKSPQITLFAVTILGDSHQDYTMFGIKDILGILK